MVSERTVAMRPYCARMMYQNMSKFILGTFWAPAKASQYEIDCALWEHVDHLLPQRPMLLELLPGSIFFSPDTSNQ
jgi:hypothetical protein